MDRLALKLTFAAAALLVGTATPSAGQQFEYTPYKGSNNTGQPPDLPPDNYTPMHQGGAAPGPVYGNGAPPSAPAYQDQGGARDNSRSDAYDDDDRGGATSGNADSPPRGAYSPSRDTYSPPGGAYSPSEDVYSPSRGAPAAPPPPPSAPPRGVGGPRAGDLGGDLPRIEVQASAPDDGVPYPVRERDARRAAIEGWRAKVSDRYGPEFSQWRIAGDKHLDCHPDRRDGITCIASAQPVRGFDRDGPPPRDDRY
jgi:hypothetical protein